jgi:hypothetical protein
MLTLASTILLITQTLSAVPVTAVIATTESLPPANSAWIGESSHLFMGGQAVLTCSSHGTISGSGEPPKKQGRSSVIEYGAVFKGELKLYPPLVPSERSFTLNDPIRMTEKLTLKSNKRSIKSYVTELTAVDFFGSGLPDYISIRESHSRRSTGKATIGRSKDGTFKVQSSYEVWLEISVDHGRSWSLASEAVTMRLAPEVKSASLSVRESTQ